MSAIVFFRQAFERAPEVTSHASGRVNLIGEHIDYNGGTVLPAAIARYVHVAVARNNGSAHRIASDRFAGIFSHVPGTAKTGSWADYASGALEKATELGLISGTVDMALVSNIPDGAGLSSSSALVAAVLRACGAISGAQLEQVALANASRAVENDYIGMPCGVMDQMAIALTEPGQALALNTATITHQCIAIPDAFSFVILHSGVNRKLSDGRYLVRFKECETASMALDAEHLCLLNDKQRASIKSLPANLAARARHVVTEHERTLAAIEVMAAGQVAEMGRLMSESHASYSDDFEASTPEIDALVQSCISEGAYGARLTGGGFGGCVVCLVPKIAERRDRWLKAVLARHENARQVV